LLPKHNVYLLDVFHFRQNNGIISVQGDMETVLPLVEGPQKSISLKWKATWL